MFLKFRKYTLKGGYFVNETHVGMHLQKGRKVKVKIRTLSFLTRGKCLWKEVFVHLASLRFL